MGWSNGLLCTVRVLKGSGGVFYQPLSPLSSLSLSLSRKVPETELANELLESTSSAKAPLEPMMVTHAARLNMSNPIHLSALSAP